MSKIFVKSKLVAMFIKTILKMQTIDSQRVIFHIVSKIEIVSIWFLESYTMQCNFGPNEVAATKKLMRA